MPVVRKSHHIPTVARGDGSAPKPGKDATTASSDGGAIMEARPDYLSNPPPLYPDASRRSKQEGVVVLSVVVSEEGRPDTVAVQTTSGFDPLDQSAVTAVRKWRFRPATLGSMKVKSRVTIPVRFRLGIEVGWIKPGANAETRKRASPDHRTEVPAWMVRESA